jgi:hypothetical protein
MMMMAQNSSPTPESIARMRHAAASQMAEVSSVSIPNFWLAVTPHPS